MPHSARTPDQPARPRTTTPAAAHAFGPCLGQLYGDAAQYMIKTSTGQKIGLWQDPSQFAAAMAYHGSSRHEIRSYIEVSLCIDLSLSLSSA